MDELNVLANARIPQLPPGTVIKPGYKLAMWNAETDITEQIDVSFFTSTTSQDFEWLSDTEYDTDEVVTRGGKWYQASQDVPVNIIPGTPAGDDFWDELSKSPTGLVMWRAGVFVEDDVFVVYQEGGVYTLYVLNSPDRPFVSTDFINERDNDLWIPIAGGGGGSTITNIDGGSAATVYLSTQNMDGGSAAAL